jgi:hypothetical protein
VLLFARGPVDSFIKPSWRASRICLYRDDLTAAELPWVEAPDEFQAGEMFTMEIQAMLSRAWERVPNQPNGLNRLCGRASHRIMCISKKRARPRSFDTDAISHPYSP